MKKKLLFLGFLIAVFAAVMILPASAVTLPANDAGCDFCRPTWEQIESHHCTNACVCTFTECPTCGENTVLIYCARTHKFDGMTYYSNGAGTDELWTYSLKCSQCSKYFDRSVIKRSHSLNKKYNTVAPTCISYGYIVNYCEKSHTDCCYTVDEFECVHLNFTDPMTHEYTFSETIAPGCGVQGYDLYECANCSLQKATNFVDGTNHVPTDAGTVIAPTCITAGYTQHVCSDCGQTYTVDEIPATGIHDYNITYISATCTEQGWAEYTCKVCSYSYRLKTTDATGHTPTDAGTVTPPTCTTGGYTSHICVTCNVAYTTEPTAATGHSYTAAVTPPTCTQQGYTTHTCTVCGNSYTDAKTSSTGHKYASTVIKAPTCTEKGSTKYTCSTCGDTYTSDTAATGHSYRNTVTKPTCTEGGYTTYVCTVCDHTYTGSQTAAAGHTYEETVTAPTCTESGYTTFRCSVCRDTYTGAETPAAGHSYRSTVTEPTCTEGGYTKHLCTVCLDKYTDALTLPTGHSYQSTVTDPTCTARGYTTHACTMCGESYRDAYISALGHVEEPYGMDYRCTVCGNVRVVTVGLRAVGNIFNGFQIFGSGFAAGLVDLFDGIVMADGELTTLASAAIVLIGFALVIGIALVVIRKFTNRM